MQGLCGLWRARRPALLRVHRKERECVLRSGGASGPVLAGTAVGPLKFKCISAPFPPSTGTGHPRPGLVLSLAGTVGIVSSLVWTFPPWSTAVRASTYWLWEDGGQAGGPPGALACTPSQGRFLRLDSSPSQENLKHYLEKVPEGLPCLWAAELPGGSVCAFGSQPWEKRGLIT